jgi:hypothetical protein
MEMRITYVCAVMEGGGNPVLILTTSLPDATVGTPYMAQLTAQGGTPPIVWSVITGSLPAGLVLNSISGSISGTPTGPAGLSTFTILALDGPGTGSATIVGNMSL